MAEILSGQTLEVENLMSFRGKVPQTELESIGNDLNDKVVLVGAKRIGYPITATFGIEGDLVDVEILLPIDKRVSDIDRYHYKEKLRITNALVARHRGKPAELQGTCNQLNQYITEQKLLPITVGYNVTRRIDPVDVENTEIDVYVGINPNIL